MALSSRGNFAGRCFVLNPFQFARRNSSIGQTLAVLRVADSLDDNEMVKGAELGKWGIFMLVKSIHYKFRNRVRLRRLPLFC
jgi:hypothetical protein